MNCFVKSFVNKIAGSRYGKYLPDKLYLKVLYETKMGRPLNLRNPSTFNEKLQWLKLYDRKPVYTIMVDKYAVKDYVANIIGDEYIIPTYGVWDKCDDIDWDNLPNKFVLKCTHDSGGLVICRDKLKLDKTAAVKKMNDCLKRDYYSFGREWPYKNVPHRIIAEMLLEPRPVRFEDLSEGSNRGGIINDLRCADSGANLQDLPDYKFFCFDGVVKAMFVATDRQNRAEPYFDFFDADFNYLDLRHGHPNAPEHPKKPQSFDLMKRLAARLSKGIAECRVDFYEVNGKPYFGEITFFHHGGFMPFEPSEWDRKFGDWIKLPKGASVP